MWKVVEGVRGMGWERCGVRETGGRGYSLEGVKGSVCDGE